MGDRDQNDNLKAVYQELCDSYRAIDEFRSKLLGFLPLATGTGIFLLLDKMPNVDCLPEQTRFISFTIGIFGFLITLGLFCYEIYGIKKCGTLIYSGRILEFSLGCKVGQFLTRPREALKAFNEPIAAGVIYPAVMAGWSFFGLLFKWQEFNPRVPIVVFILGCGFTFWYNRRLKNKLGDELVGIVKKNEGEIIGVLNSLAPANDQKKE